MIDYSNLADMNSMCFWGGGFTSDMDIEGFKVYSKVYITRSYVYDVGVFWVLSASGAIIPSNIDPISTF